MADILSLVKNVPLCRHLDLSTLKKLCQGLEFTTVAQGEYLFIAGTPVTAVYIISYGSLRLTKCSADGREVAITFIRQGDFAGAGVMTESISLYPVNAIAHEDCGLIKISKKFYLENWASHSELFQAIHLHLMRRMIELQNDKLLSIYSVPKRIAAFLLQMLDQQDSRFGNTINIPLARKDIAQRVGTTVETVIRVLSEWTQKEWIQTKEQHIEIKNRTALFLLVETEK